MHLYFQTSHDLKISQGFPELPGCLGKFWAYLFSPSRSECISYNHHNLHLEDRDVIYRVEGFLYSFSTIPSFVDSGFNTLFTLQIHSSVWNGRTHDTCRSSSSVRDIARRVIFGVSVRRARYARRIPRYGGEKKDTGYYKRGRYLFAFALGTMPRSWIRVIFTEIIMYKCSMWLFTMISGAQVLKWCRCASYRNFSVTVFSEIQW